MLSTWRDQLKRDGRILIIIVLPTGILEIEDGVATKVIAEKQVRLTLRWPIPATSVQKLVSGVLAVETNLNISDGTVMEQEFDDFLSKLRLKEADPISSTWDIPLLFAVKPDFDEQVIMFEDSETQLYLLQFRPPEKKDLLCVSTFYLL